MEITLEDIRAAKRAITDVVKRTPTWSSRTLSEIAGVPAFLKMENMQRTGSFKVRGALYRMKKMSEAERSRGVIAASAGNHAQGVALGAGLAGVKATVVMPETAAMSKISATRGYGATVVVHGRSYDEAFQKAVEIRDRTGATLIHAFDDPDVIAGQGTAGLEIVEDLGKPFTLLCPIGGGGLAAGVALAVKESIPGARVIGVQAEGASAFFDSWLRGTLSPSDSAQTIADGLAVKAPGRLTFEIGAKYLDGVVTVGDEDIAGAVLFLLERAKVLAEGAGAAATAALIAGRVSTGGMPVVAFVSGGNMDVTVLSRIIQRGLVRAGRVFNLGIVLEDRPGALHALLGLVAQSGANVVSVEHDRLKTGTPLGSVEVRISIEIRDHQHACSLLSRLRSDGYKLVEPPQDSQEIDPACGIIPEEVRP